jgi:hypothetical protein
MRIWVPVGQIIRSALWTWMVSRGWEDQHSIPFFSLIFKVCFEVSIITTT